MSEIDGDLLLFLREEHLRDDLGMDNSIHRMRRVKRVCQIIALANNVSFTAAQK